MPSCLSFHVLEYYEGNLILTSNRIGTFDEAFKSRVQLTLHYPPLDRPRRRRIWNSFLRMLHQQTGVEVRIEELRDKIDSLSGNRLNGWEI
ncbi:uncharacterized protein CDV56_101579 [Aspergillus thermomutatus]|uniref:ATPase AAA-type core domain-containing protein n=1 Tax=Aspergillus thermomutatus TaxID=41047 RepID=A0A397G874_ASPTH|nr:uncharacterized protein CDV56_101579 [Aspergillus thermomutatus]RHZ45143.1 hypothetical protein CDV56_101579 [Aspergillus thermomutatus]